MRQRSPEAHRGGIGLVLDTCLASGKSCASDTKVFRQQSPKLHGRRKIARKHYIELSLAGKDQRKVMTAVARELLGFIWAIAIKAEADCPQPMPA